MRSNYLVKALVLLLCVGLINACKDKQTIPKSTISSPSGNVKVNFFLTANKAPAYQVLFHDQVVIDTSFLGFDLKDQLALKDNFEVVTVAVDSAYENWELPWGEQLKVTNRYNELIISLKESTETARLMNVIFRVYDDGLGFRYDFPEQNNFQEAIILEENTQFKLTGDHETWWMPGDWDSY